MNRPDYAISQNTALAVIQSVAEGPANGSHKALHLRHLERYLFRAEGDCFVVTGF